MSRSFPTTIIQAMNAQSTSEVFLAIIDIKHSTFSTFYYVNNFESITSNGQVYSPFPFSLILPETSEDTAPVFTLRISNVSREIIDEIRGVAGLRERMKIDISIIAASDPDTLLATWPDFELVNVDYNREYIIATLSLENLFNEPFPGDSFSPANFPGLF